MNIPIRRVTVSCVIHNDHPGRVRAVYISADSSENNIRDQRVAKIIMITTTHTDTRMKIVYLRESNVRVIIYSHECYHNVIYII